MDFITLANAAHETSRSLLRILSDAEDDDFSHLENAGHGNGSPFGGSMMGSSDGLGSTAETAAMNRPLLSPTAEAALLELSTNFLLCKWLLLHVHCALLEHYQIY